MDALAADARPHATPTTGEALDPVRLVQALCAVWEERRMSVKRRLVLIERALAALAVDGLDEQLGLQARRAAHSLAGSVAMFGFVRAAEIARRLELELASPEPARAGEALSMTLQVREEIERPLRLAAAVASDAQLAGASAPAGGRYR